MFNVTPYHPARFAVHRRKFQAYVKIVIICLWLIYCPDAPGIGKQPQSSTTKRQ